MAEIIISMEEYRKVLEEKLRIRGVAEDEARQIADIYATNAADRVISQAEEYGHSEKREMAFLIAHSVLHVCGFDHEAPEDAALMEERQEQILNNLGIYR